jgi:hypothetical protein
MARGGQHGVPRSIASNLPDPDGLIVFPPDAHGTLSRAKLHDGGGGSPCDVQFRRNRPDHFILGYALAEGVVLGRKGRDGQAPDAT